MAESTRQREAFDAYWRLGRLRSLRRLEESLKAAGWKVSLRTLESWSATGHWPQQIGDLEAQARIAEDEARREELREMAERHRKEGLLLQQAGASWLRDLPLERVTGADAVRAIAEGVRLERLSVGEPTARDEVTLSQRKLEVLSDAELDRLIDNLPRDLEGEGPAEPR